MKIPFLDLTRTNARQADALAAACAKVVRGGWYILGEEVAAFEREFAAHVGVRHCVGVASGLDALTQLLRAAIIDGDLRPDDEILVPANTYVATMFAITQAGLTPAPVEADAESFNITAAAAEEAAARRERVRAVMAVHLYGRAAPLGELRELCRRRGWLLFEDAAQAHGAAVDGGQCGAGGDAAGFSFYPSKNLGALGDGGAVTTNDARRAEIIRCLRNYGSAQKNCNAYVGVNSRLDEMQAAMLRVKLPLLDEDNARRRALAKRYLSAIRHPEIILPSAPADENSHVWHLFVVRCAERDKLAEYLKNAGIETAIHYPTPPHRQPAYAATPLAAEQLPGAEKLAETVLSLPLSPAMEDAEVDAVSDALNAFNCG